MVILFEANFSVLFVTHIQKATHKSTADGKVVNLIDHMLSFNLRAERSDSLPPMKAMETVEIHKVPTIIVTVARAAHPRPMFKQDVV